LFALPVFAYEMILAVWLITKGFNPEALALNKRKNPSTIPRKAAMY
jgi:hypothetical protein